MDKIYREATIKDIPILMEIRFAVKENVLNNRSLVTEQICENYLLNCGKGWVCEIENKVRGFCMVDIVDNSVWALFIHPDFENKGIGKALQRTMLDWYFNQTDETIWLTTAPHTRAEQFYIKTGWTKIGIEKNGELKFEMSKQRYLEMG